MNNGNPKNLPNDSNFESNSNKRLNNDLSSNVNENTTTDNTINYHFTKDNIDMKNFIDENNQKETIRQISASNDFCVICEVKISLIYSTNKKLY